jgi:hypothetical protein
MKFFYVFYGSRFLKTTLLFINLTGINTNFKNHISHIRTYKTLRLYALM